MKRYILYYSVTAFLSLVIAHVNFIFTGDISPQLIIFLFFFLYVLSFALLLKKDRENNTSLTIKDVTKNLFIFSASSVLLTGILIFTYYIIFGLILQSSQMTYAALGISVSTITLSMAHIPFIIISLIYDYFQPK